MKTDHLIMTLAATIGCCALWCDAASAKAHAVVRAYEDTGDPNTALTQGEHTVTTRKVQCPIAEYQCSLALTVMDQVCNAGQYGWQIIVEVDGTAVSRGAWVTPVGSNCGGATWAGSAIGVAAGYHSITLITKTTAPSGDRQGQWAVNCLVTTGKSPPHDGPE